MPHPDAHLVFSQPFMQHPRIGTVLVAAKGRHYSTANGTCDGNYCMSSGFTPSGMSEVCVLRAVGVRIKA